MRRHSFGVERAVLQGGELDGKEIIVFSSQADHGEPSGGASWRDFFDGWTFGDGRLSHAAGLSMLKYRRTAKRRGGRVVFEVQSA